MAKNNPNPSSVKSAKPAKTEKVESQLLAPRRRKPLDIPFEQDQSNRFIAPIIGLLSFMAVLAFAGALSLQALSTRWEEALASSVSINVPPLLSGEGLNSNSDNQSLEQESDPRLAQIVTIALTFEGVLEAKILSKQEMLALVRPWLGNNIESERLPLPRLINLTIDIEQPPDFVKLQQQLEDNVAGARLNDFQEWRLKLFGYIQALSLLGVLIICAISIGAACLIIFVSLAGLATHRPSIELLHLIGAKDSYIAGQFQSQTIKAALKGSIGGYLFALIAILLFGHLGMEANMLTNSVLVLSISQWFILLLVPIMTVLLAAFSARFTVIRVLSRML